MALIEAGPGRRRRHQQGEHRDPAHRLRRQAGHARVAPGRARVRAALALRRGGRHPGRADRRAAGRLERRAARRAARRSRRALARQRLRPGRERRRRGALPARAAPRPRAPSARSRSPTRASICPFTHAARVRDPGRARGAASCAATAGDGVERLGDGGCQRRDLARRADTTRWVVNAAGLHSDEVDRMLGHERLHGHPAARRADRLRQARRPLVTTSCCRSRRNHARASWSRPTVFGNVILGPTAEDVERKDDTGSTAEGIAQLLDAGAGGSCPACSSRRRPPSTSGCAPRPSTPTTSSAVDRERATPAPAASARPG